MDKLLIGLYVPAILEHFDLFAPPRLQVSVLTEILANSVSDLSNGRYTVSGREMLSTQDTSILLHPERCLADYGIEDGAQFILI